MPEILSTLRERLGGLRQHLRRNRADYVDEALSLLDVGLDADEVYLELREKYLDAIPAMSAAADDAIDWDDVIRGAGGDILEAVDGKVVDALLRLVVRAADRQRARRKRGQVTLGDILRRSKGRPVRDIIPDVVVSPTPDDQQPGGDTASSRSGGLGWDGGLDI